MTAATYACTYTANAYSGCSTAQLQNWKNAKITQIIETCASTLKLAAALPHKSLLKSEKNTWRKKSASQKGRQAGRHTARQGDEAARRTAEKVQTSWGSAALLLLLLILNWLAQAMPMPSGHKDQLSNAANCKTSKLSHEVRTWRNRLEIAADIWRSGRWIVRNSHQTA